MAWVAVDKNLEEYIYDECPIRHINSFQWTENTIELPSGSIEKLIGRKLTWSDEPVELKEE